MSFDAFFLTLVLAAFAVFAGALAWADYQTRGLSTPKRAEPPADERKAA